MNRLGDVVLLCLLLWPSPNKASRYDTVRQSPFRKKRNDDSRSTRSRLSPQLVSAAGRRHLVGVSDKAWRLNKAIVNESPSVGTNSDTSSEVAWPETGKSSMWPPWPFNLLQKANDENVVGSGAMGNKRAGAELVLKYLRERALVGARQLQQVTLGASTHLPPASPPLILLALIPIKRQAESSSGSYLVNILARRMALASFGVAIMSWSHCEIRKKKRLSPLPYLMDYTETILPPFLPEAIEFEREEMTEAGEGVLNISSEEVPVKDNTVNLHESPAASSYRPLYSKLKHQVADLYGTAKSKATPSIKATYFEWSQMRRRRRHSLADARRNAIMKELKAMQTLKAQIRTSKNPAKKWGRKIRPNDIALPLGWAMVTGASGGLGRAIAVELARRDVPLILVARDEDRLTALADELNACYGVPTLVIPCDLSLPDSAKKLHRTTVDNGLNVDALVNNAGVCHQGPTVHQTLPQILGMIDVNVVCVTLLNALYGQDMKRRGRGRILNVSSITGSVPAGPGVAIYSATKAYEKSLSLSMGKELEPHGIGVTCLMPGAIGDTSFRKRSGTEDALCWKIPFYPRTAEEVAGRGVRGMLRGDGQVMPGWQNRVFVKAVQQILPERVMIMIVETAWNPLTFGRRQEEDTHDAGLHDTANGEDTTSSRAGRMNLTFPQVLRIEEDEPIISNNDLSGPDPLEQDPDHSNPDHTEGESPTLQQLENPREIVYFDKL